MLQFATLLRASSERFEFDNKIVPQLDPQTIIGRATFENPNQLPEGMQFVLVNGILVIDGGKATGALPGKVLRGPGYLR